MTRKSVAPATVDVLGEVIDALHAGDNPAALSDARKVVGAMDQRPWEQLPSRLKSAIRLDIRRLIDGGADEAILQAEGYSPRIVRSAKRDLGLGG